MSDSEDLVSSSESEQSDQEAPVKQRSQPFTAYETIQLLELVEQYKRVVESKKTDFRCKQLFLCIGEIGL
jgi:hypothetical protein